MFKADAKESVPICNTVLGILLAQTPTQGLTGASLRQAVSTFRVNAMPWLMANAAGPPLESIFRMAQTAGITLPQMEVVRIAADSQPAVSDGAILVRDSLVQYALYMEGLIIQDMTFVSRDDVDATRLIVNSAYAPAEEAAADAMDSATYQALINAHAGIVYFLTQTAQPLPMMLNFQFATPMPTLVAAYKLYADASRGDDLLAQNHVVHPAFMHPTGRALSN
jgi:prophage DNA circulation protein